MITPLTRGRPDWASYVTIARTIPGQHEAAFTPHQEVRREAAIADVALVGADLEAAAHSRVTGEGDGLGAVGGAKLEQNRRYVVLHRLDADAHSG